jgi:hypothetical protein
MKSINHVAKEPAMVVMVILAFLSIVGVYLLFPSPVVVRARIRHSARGHRRALPRSGRRQH